MSGQNRYNLSKKVSFISLLVNIILALAKIIIGYFFASKALIADGLHSVSDLASTIVILLSMKFSQSPADKKHPYGHGKAEQIGTLILGFMLFFTGLTLIKDTALNIVNGRQEVPALITAGIALLSILSKEALYQYTIRIGKRIKSKGLVADAHHHRSDAFSSIAALFGIMGARLGYPFLDPLAGLVVAVLIVKIGFEILREAIHELMDGIPDEGKLKDYRDIVKEIPGVRDVGDIKLRSYGPELIIDLTVAVDKNLSVAAGHEVADNVKKKLLKIDANIKEVMVHVDPWLD